MSGLQINKPWTSSPVDFKRYQSDFECISIDFDEFISAVCVCHCMGRSAALLLPQLPYHSYRHHIDCNHTNTDSIPYSCARILGLRAVDPRYSVIRCSFMTIWPDTAAGRPQLTQSLIALAAYGTMAPSVRVLLWLLK